MPDQAELLDELGELSSDLAYAIERLDALGIPLSADLRDRVGLAAQRACCELSGLVVQADSLIPAPRLERPAEQAPARGFRLSRRQRQ